MFALVEKVSRRLARHFPTATLAARGFGPIVSFTFDDAPVSAATQGAAVLEDEGARGTFYLSAGMLGGHSDIQPIVSAAQVRDLAYRGHEIACHSFGHLELCRWTNEALRADLDANRGALMKLSGAAPTNFAYPYGRFSLQTKHLLETRFTSCRGIYPGVNVGEIDLGLLHAVPLYDCGGDEAILRWIAAAARRRGWLIFVTHDVQDHPTRFGTEPERLRAYVRAAKAAGCACMTVERTLESIQEAAACAADIGVGSAQLPFAAGLNYV